MQVRKGIFVEMAEVQNLSIFYEQKEFEYLFSNFYCSLSIFSIFLTQSYPVLNKFSQTIMNLYPW